jgi:hypothetical protein
LLSLVDSIMRKGIVYFIETGTNVGSTLAYVAKTYPHLQCLSCEPDSKAYKKALQNCGRYKNVSLYNMTSQEFISYIKKNKPEVFQQECLFWLDAHGYGFRWPLRDEINFLTANLKNGYVLIDDFKVPHLDCFGYDEYDGQICSYDFIKDAFATNDFELYYPHYAERTSVHHPLRGWALIVLGGDFSIPHNLSDKIILSSEKDTGNDAGNDEK